MEKDVAINKGQRALIIRQRENNLSPFDKVDSHLGIFTFIIKLSFFSSFFQLLSFKVSLFIQGRNLISPAFREGFFNF